MSHLPRETPELLEADVIAAQDEVNELRRLGDDGLFHPHCYVSRDRVGTNSADVQVTFALITAVLNDKGS